MMKIGISMRVTNAIGYEEPRDSIARDWSDYMMDCFPEWTFLFIPNIGDLAVDYIRKWDINVLFLSGGDNLGVDEARDSTEIALLEYALDAGIPIVGICRGLQLIHTYFGGQIVRGDDRFVLAHRAARHKVIIESESYDVNSYHDNIIDESSISSEFEIVARCSDDNTIEGFRRGNILAIMWHPERENRIADWNKRLIENHIKNEY